jgi:hypothetical protein
MESKPPKVSPDIIEFVGIGNQEPKYLELPAETQPTADQAFDALLRNVMVLNEYRSESEKYYLFTRFSENIIILLSRIDSLMCVYDEKTKTIAPVPYSSLDIRDLHTDGTVEIHENLQGLNVYTLCQLSDVNLQDYSLKTTPLWAIYDTDNKPRYYIYETDPKSKKWVANEVSRWEFFDFANKYTAPLVEWNDLNASNIRRVIACDSPLDSYYRADFSDYTSLILTMRGIAEVCRQAYLVQGKVNWQFDTVGNDYFSRHKNLFSLSDQEDYETLSTLLSFCTSSAMPTYTKKHDIKNLFGYCLRDLNSDGTDELLLMVQNDEENKELSGMEYKIFAIFTMANNKAVLLGTYPSGCWIRGDGTIVHNGKVELLSADGGSLETIEHFGISVSSSVSSILKYFKTVDGARVPISADEYLELQKTYSPPEEPEKYRKNLLRISPTLILERSFSITPSTDANTPTPDLPALVDPSIE